MVATAVAAGAHTQVQRATPGPGEAVSGAVEQVELDFLDPLLAAPDVSVTGPGGAPVEGLSPAELVAPDVAVARFDPLSEPGRYTVEYGYASEDGAAQSGAHQFTYAPAPADPPDGKDGEDGEDGSGMLPVTAATVRLFLHVLAATIWVGGQLTLAGLVPGLRAVSADAPRAAARRFNRIAWPAYGVLVATGIWNLVESSFGDRSTEWHVTLFVKLVLVALSGASALAHSVTSSRVVLAVGGALAGLSSLGALFLGVQLALGG